jgi:hypothetical protein
MSCERYADAILEQALGEPAAPELEAHLRTCDACRETLERERRLIGTIDGELREAVSVSPRPWFRRGVRERIASESRRRRLQRYVLLPVAASVVVSIAAWSLMRRAPLPPQSVRATAAATPALPAPPAPAAAAPFTPAVPATRIPTQRVARRLDRRPEPEVLVPAGEEELTRRFVVSLRARRPDQTAVVAGTTESESPELAIPLLAEIPPIEMKPLMSSTDPKEPIE